MPPEEIGLTVAGVTVPVEDKSISDALPDDGASVLTCCRLSVETGTVEVFGGFGAVGRDRSFLWLTCESTKYLFFENVLEKYCLLFLMKIRTLINIKEEIQH